MAGEALSQSILAFSLFFLSATSSSSPSASDIITLPEARQEVYYAVKKGESLSQIAQRYYGNADSWGLLWIDNPEIENPNVIEKGQILRLRTQRADVPLIVQINATSEIEKLTVDQKRGSGAFHTSSTGPLTEEQMTFLGNCESGMQASVNTGNGYYGAFQFTVDTWNNMNTGYARADQAPLEVQKDAVQRLLQRSSIWTQFPGCAVRMKSAGLL